MENKKIKVLIGDDSAEYGVVCANELRSMDLYVMTRRRDGNVILDSIRNDHPDVVVVDAILPGMDAIELLEETMSMEHRPTFIVTSAYENEFIERQIMERGAAYFMLKPLRPPSSADVFCGSHTQMRQTACGSWKKISKR